MGKLIQFPSLFGLFLTFAIPMVASSVQPEHIFLLAGQSNMMGHGGVRDTKDGQEYWDRYVPPECRPNPKIFLLNREFSWAEAKEPIHAGIFPKLRVTGIGPGMPFARRILESNPGFGTIGLVPCAFDWTNMDEWSRNYTHQDSKNNLYRNLIARASESVRMGGKLASLLWWQGGKDASNFEDANGYKDKLENFFKDVRADLRRPDLPIVVIIIPPGRAPFIDTVREAQKSLNLPNLVKIDLPELPYEPDMIHISSDGQVIVGRVVADHYCSAGYC